MKRLLQHKATIPIPLNSTRMLGMCCYACCGCNDCCIAGSPQRKVVILRSSTPHSKPLLHSYKPTHQLQHPQQQQLQSDSSTQQQQHIHQHNVQLLGFFNGLAHERNFHPTKGYEGWYNITADDILSKVCCVLVCSVLCCSCWLCVLCAYIVLREGLCLKRGK